MPKVGLSRLYLAKYSADTLGNVTYTGGKRSARMVNYSTSIASTDNNDFYADDELAESETGRFLSGTVSVETAEIDTEMSAMILGLTPVELTDEELGADATEYVYDDDAKSQNLGMGIIEKRISHGKTTWRPIVFRKVCFNIPDNSATTQGESISWQTDSATAKIMRDDRSKHAWKSEATFDTVEKADRYIRLKLNMLEETP